ncbi:XdhC family protein [Roseixanthobacter glucoisosaccharinicivorans]|uniref:XdhC family protein n=1 Tax=Roseixanthobacter glucoisosaccharinicivorans TaxID=3119923 RepID=UPI00372B2F47
MNLEILAQLTAARAARRAAVLVTELETGVQRLVAGEAVSGDALEPSLRAALASGKSGILETPNGRVFLTVQVPPPRIVAIGAVHISQALAPLARIAGYDLTVIDPRTAFATPERFPDTTVIAKWPDEALKEVTLDAFTAVAALTHDPKIDEPALQAALKAGCFYVGALGSRRTHAKRVERLSALGVSQEEIGRIHAPIGLDIGAASPEEIAVSVLAQIIGALRKGSLAPARTEAAA